MWPNPQFPADLATFNEEILNGKLHFLCSLTSESYFTISAAKPVNIIQQNINFKKSTTWDGCIFAKM